MRALDELAALGGEPVIVQLGASRHALRWATGFRAVTSREFVTIMREARVVVTHGGDTVLEAVALGLPVVLVPRRRSYHEHIDDHQVELAEALAERGIVTWAEPDDLRDAVARARPAVAQPNAQQLVRSVRNALGLP